MKPALNLTQFSSLPLLTSPKLRNTNPQSPNLTMAGMMSYSQDVPIRPVFRWSTLWFYLFLRAQMDDEITQIHRSYRSPKLNYVMQGCALPACSSCGESVTDLFHCFRSCPISQSFWQRIHQFLVRHTTYQISLDPTGDLFGSLQQSDLSITPHSKRLIF